MWKIFDKKAMQNSSPRYVIITAGGSGTRMGAAVPKQMLEIEGKPILRYTIEKFLSLPFEVKIILVMNKDAKESWKEYCRQSDFRFNHILVDGGITRFHSVKNGLKYVPSGAVPLPGYRHRLCSCIPSFLPGCRWRELPPCPPHKYALP